MKKLDSKVAVVKGASKGVYTTLRDGIFAHPTMAEGLTVLLPRFLHERVPILHNPSRDKLLHEVRCGCPCAPSKASSVGRLPAEW